jgi:microcystin-dependent protein
MFCSDVVPTGYLQCDGSSVSRITYANLFAIIGTRFGSLNVSSFNLPETRGIFVRGWNNTNTTANFNDVDSSTRIALKTGGNTGNNVGSY